MVADEPCLVAADGTGTYTTIQDAVDAASEGDVITVCPGVYDAVTIDTVGVTLQGYGAESTCIFGTSGTGLTIDGVDVDISGFTISGQATEPGAIALRDASGLVHDVRVAGVESGSAGLRFAVRAADSEVTWENVTFEHNLVDWALAIYDGSTTIRHSVFDHNATGLSVAGTEGRGCGLEVTNCIFTQNSLHGLYISGPVAGTVANNVFYKNSAGFETTDHPDVYVAKRNNVALSNRSGGFGGYFVDSDYNVSWDNMWWGAMGTHDMVTDPLFEDAGIRDFRLQAASTLIDAGDPAYDDVDGTRNDIGLYGGPQGE